MFRGKKMSRKGNEIIFFDIKQYISWRGKQIDEGHHVKEFSLLFLILKSFQIIFPCDGDIL